MQNLLLSTVHGSRLYGLSHAGSDFDSFEVYGYDKFRPRHSVKGADDVTTTSYDRFMVYCERGVPQYLEAMFSRVATTDAMPFNRLSYRPSRTATRERYMRTVKAFWLEGWEAESFKKRRHAVRLAVNLRTMEEYGRFNPELTDKEVNYCNDRANDPYTFGVL